MFRDDRDAMVHQLDTLTRESEQLRRENAAMRNDLLAMQRGAPMVQFNPYKSDASWLTPGQRAALSHHGIQPFPVWAMALLHIVTFGLFPLIHFGLQHDRLPHALPDDPTAGKAIGFSFIPLFNLWYWNFFNSLRLCDRLDLQYRIRGLTPKAPKGLMIACSILTVHPYLYALVGWLFLWPFGVCFLQHAINGVATLGPMADPAAPSPPAPLDTSRPPAGLLPR